MKWKDVCYSFDEVIEESDKIYEVARQISISKNAE